MVYGQKIDQTTREFGNTPPAVSTSKSSGNTTGISTSDSGAQRPIFLILKKSPHLSAMMLR